VNRVREWMQGQVGWCDVRRENKRRAELGVKDSKCGKQKQGRFDWDVWMRRERRKEREGSGFEKQR
jgi:hypothetical protein